MSSSPSPSLFRRLLVSRSGRDGICAANQAHADARPVSLIVLRQVKEGCHDRFEQALRDFVAFAVSFPGHLDIHVLTRAQDEGEQCAVANRFASRSIRQAFTRSPQFRHWLTQLNVLTEPVSDSSQPTMPAAPFQDRVPGLGPRLVILVALGLFIAAFNLPIIVYSFLDGWHPEARTLLTAILLVFVAGGLIRVALTKPDTPASS